MIDHKKSKYAMEAVKKPKYLPKSEAMTIKMAADYLEISKDVLYKYINKEENDLKKLIYKVYIDGVHKAMVLSPSAIVYFCRLCPSSSSIAGQISYLYDNKGDSAEAVIPSLSSLEISDSNSETKEDLIRPKGAYLSHWSDLKKSLKSSDKPVNGKGRLEVYIGANEIRRIDQVTASSSMSRSDFASRAIQIVLDKLEEEDGVIE